MTAKPCLVSLFKIPSVCGAKRERAKESAKLHRKSIRIMKTAVCLRTGDHLSSTYATCHHPLSYWISAVDLDHGLLKLRSLQPQFAGLIEIS